MHPKVGLVSTHGQAMHQKPRSRPRILFGVKRDKNGRREAVMEERGCGGGREATEGTERRGKNNV